ncbi:MAG: VCBS repeat-containing protein, partial [Planctomycetota bacterium]
MQSHGHAVCRCTLLIASLLATEATGQEDIRSTPHGERESGPVRFERLDPTESGVVFQNRILEQNRLPYVYSGSGVAVGDYDGDDRPDIYLVCLDGPNKLFRQTEDLKFVDVTEETGVDGGDAWGWGAVFADIDGDRDLDLYVANLESPDKLYRNDGNGKFTECAEAFGLGDDGAGAMPAFADYDRDGDLDLYLLRNRSFGMQLIRPLLNRVQLPSEIKKTIDELAPRLPDAQPGSDQIVFDESFRSHLFVHEGRTFFAGQPDILYRNDGGRFVDVTEESGIADYGMGLSVTWWDFDDDGWLDLFVANDLQWPDQLYRNRGDGTFEDVTAEALPTVAFFGMGSDFGDIDNDGRFDLVVADMAMRRHFDAKVLMGNMDAQSWFLENGPGPQVMRNNLFLNTGAGAFLEVANLTKAVKTNWTWALRF